MKVSLLVVIVEFGFKHLAVWSPAEEVPACWCSTRGARSNHCERTADGQLPSMAPCFFLAAVIDVFRDSVAEWHETLYVCWTNGNVQIIFMFACPALLSLHPSSPLRQAVFHAEVCHHLAQRENSICWVPSLMVALFKAAIAVNFSQACVMLLLSLPHL